MTTNSNNGFVSAIWGPPMWLSIHCISLNYPCSPTAAEKISYRRWFEGLEQVLPCGICRSNFKQNLKDIEYDADKHFESRLMFSYIVWTLHKNIREMQGKSSDMTFYDCVLFYEQFRAQDCVPNTSDGEGGCFAKKNVACTVYITTEPAQECGFEIDPACEIGIE
jgi:hypothetical protein